LWGKGKSRCASCPGAAAAAVQIDGSRSGNPFPAGGNVQRQLCFIGMCKLKFANGAPHNRFGAPQLLRTAFSACSHATAMRAREIGRTRRRLACGMCVACKAARGRDGVANFRVVGGCNESGIMRRPPPGGGSCSRASVVGLDAIA
jgi:hypothetical protein